MTKQCSLYKISNQKVRKIVLATTSSGITTTLLTGDRTLHSTFNVPLDLHSMYGHFNT